MDPLDDRDIPDYGAVIRRYWRPVVAFTILGAVLAGLALHVVPHRYTAHASVLVQPIDTSSDSGGLVGSRTPSATVNLDTEAQLVKSTPVATRAKELLGSSSSISALVSRVLVTVPANSSVLVISYTAHTPALAAAGAHDFATAYLANRSSSAQADVDVQSKAYTKQLLSLDSQLQHVTDKLVTEPPSSATRAYDLALKANLSGQINSLSTALNQLTTTALIPGAIIADAVPPVRPSGPNRTLYLASGVMLGLLAGLLVGVARSALDKRIKTPREIENAGVEVLASLPKGTSGNALASSSAAAIRSVQQLSSLLSNALAPSSAVVVIGVGTDSTLVVSNLAIALAQSERRVAVVCVGSRSRATARLLHAVAEQGLSEVISGRATLTSAIQTSLNHPGIFTLAPGSNSEVDSASAASFERILSELRRRVDVVLVQTPPADESSDATAQILAGVADGALLVAEINRTRRDRFADNAALLNRMGSQVFGAVTIRNSRWRRRREAATPSVSDWPIAARPAPGSPQGFDHFVGGAIDAPASRSRRAVEAAPRSGNGHQDESASSAPTTVEHDEVGWPESATTRRGTETPVDFPSA
jgi:capsular polysaccharide biosynthesis protein